MANNNDFPLNSKLAQTASTAYRQALADGAANPVDAAIRAALDAARRAGAGRAELAEIEAAVRKYLALNPPPPGRDEIAPTPSSPAAPVVEAPPPADRDIAADASPAHRNPAGDDAETATNRTTHLPIPTPPDPFADKPTPDFNFASTRRVATEIGNPPPTTTAPNFLAAEDHRSSFTPPPTNIGDAWLAHQAFTREATTLPGTGPAPQPPAPPASTPDPGPQPTPVPPPPATTPATVPEPVPATPPADAVAPTLTGLTPAGSSSALAADGNLVLTFSEAVKAGSGQIVLTNGSDTRSIAIGDTSQVVIAGNTVTINPLTDLVPGSSYQVQLSDGVLTDLAGNSVAGNGTSTTVGFTTEPAPAPNTPPPSDTTAPALAGSTPIDNSIGVAVDSNIALVFNEAVRTGNGQILITDGTDSRSIAIGDASQVAISGNIVTVNPTGDLNLSRHYHVEITAGALTDLAGNPYAGIGDATTLDFSTPFPISGSVIDGYISGARIYVDLNDNGIAEAGEDSGLVTDSTGRFAGTTALATGHAFLAVGGVNIDTGLLNTVVLKAPSESTVINPLTTLIQAYKETNGGTSASAETAIQTALSLPNVDLLTYDPMALGDATGVTVQKAQAQVASLILLAADDTTTTAQATTDAIVANLVTASAGTIDLTNAATLTTLLTGANTTATPALVDTATDTIAAATSIALISNAQLTTVVVYVDHVAPGSPTAAPDLLASSDTGGSSTDNRTGDTTPTLRISLDTWSVDGTAAAVADVVRIYDGATLVATSAPLTSTDITRKYIDVTTSVLATDLAALNATHTLTAKLVDYAGNIGATSSSLAITFDPLGTLDGSTGFRLNGAAAYDRSGMAVSDVGDINGDGFGDIAIGVKYANSNGAYSGASYVFFGKSAGFASSITLSTLNGTTGFRLDGAAAGDNAGASVSAAGDVNGDGYADFIVGAPSADPNGTSSGSSYVVFGKTAAFTSTLNLSTLNGSTGFRINGVAGNDQSGFSANAAGDLNGDGFADLLVGAPYADPSGSSQSGAAYVVFGKVSGFASSLNLSTLNGGVATGFRISGAAANDRAGYAVSAAGDVNGDGYADFIVGARDADPNGSGSGAAYVVFGKAGVASSNLGLGSLDGSTGFRLNGVAAADAAGISVAAAGDVNGDGFADLVVGAKWADANGSNAGASYVVFGKSTAFASTIDLSALDGNSGFRLAGAAANDGSGNAVSTAGDLNGDGFDDLFVGAVLADPNGAGSGASYVVFGKASGFASTLNLSTLSGSSGFRLAGVAGYDYAGIAVSTAGDVNGDGFADLVVGAKYANSFAGASYVVFGSDATAAVNFIGTANADTQTGTAVGQRFVAGAGNDTMTGFGGADVFHAGPGNDTIRVADLGFRLVDGGPGSDTLTFTAGGLTLTPASLPGRIRSIETINLNGGANTLTLTALDVVDLSESSNTLTIDGNGTDVVNAGSGWIDGGTGGSYHTWTRGQAKLRLNTAITANISGDAAAPTLVSSTPTDEAGSVAISSDIVLTFNEAVVAGASGNITISNGAGDTRTIAVTDATQVIFSGGNSVTINPTANLIGTTPYYVQIAAGAIKDPLGNAYAGIADTTTLNFTTAPATGFSLSTLNGSSGFRLTGSSGSFSSPTSVSDAGDVNGDGYNDVILGVTGTSWLIFGKSAGFSSTLALNTLDGTTGFRLTGAGNSVSSAGDVNGDGLADLIVGTSGTSYVVFGQTSGFGTNFNLSALSGTNGFSLSGAGKSVSSAGDINGDGFADLVVGQYTTAPSGVSYVILGQAAFSSNIALSTLDGSTGFRINGAMNGGSSSKFGRSVSSAGDVNGDGFADLIIGGDGSSFFGGSPSAAWVIFGNSSPFSSTIDISSLSGTAGFRMTGVSPNDKTGFSVSGAGDINGDGLADVIVGAYSVAAGSAGSGASYVIFGKTGGFASDISLVGLDGSNGFRLEGIAANDRSGFSVSTAGDVNGDGFGDLLIGAQWASSGGFSKAGAAYVVFGKASGFPASINLASVDGVSGFSLEGVATDDRTGISVSTAGDVNGDGLADLVIGSGEGRNDYIVFGTNAAGAVTFLGSSGADNLNAGTGAAERFVGGNGDDGMVGGGGADSFHGGQGNDRISVPDLNFLRADGGSGTDTLALTGSGISLSLANLRGHVEGIEQIDLTSGDNTLTVTQMDITGLSDASNTLTVDGDAADAVIVSGGTWANQGINGSYHSYKLGTSVLRVNTAITSVSIALDVTPPSLSSNSPLDDADPVLVSSNIVLNFSEAVVAGSGNIILTNGSDTRTIAVGDTSQVMFSASVVTINPSTDLQVNTTYNLQMASGVITDPGLNPFAGILNATTLNFTTRPPSRISIGTIDGSNGFSVSGTIGSANAGQAVGSAGDINGDGFEDIVVGSLRPSSGGYEGNAYVVFGKSTAYAATAGLESLNGGNGFVLSGWIQDRSGWSVNTAGDINDDGYSDLIVGANQQYWASDKSGLSHLYYGKSSFAAGVALTSLNGSTGFRLGGAAANDYLGSSVNSVGDINGDGFADFIVDAKWADPGTRNSAGAAYVVFGKAGNFGSTFAVSSLDGTTGFRLEGVAANDALGSSPGAVSAVGDINGDGYSDFILGAPGANSGSGSAFVVFGSASTFASTINLSTLNSSSGFRLNGSGAESAGISVSEAGDVNGDGFADLIVGASANTSSNGASYVVFGKSSFAGLSTINLSSLDGSTGFRLKGSGGELSGCSVSSAGDVNGDGYSDLIVGAKLADFNGNNNSGATYIVYGKSSFAGLSSVDLSSLDGNTGYRLEGVASLTTNGTVGDQLGYSVNAAGDINGDGFADVVIGAKFQDRGTLSDYGAAHVVFGNNASGLVDHLGTGGADNLSAGAAAKRFVGGNGNDTLTGAGGRDVFHGGSGNDRIVIADTGFQLVDGGRGTDTLAFAGGGQNLDLAAMRNRIQSIEIVDLTGSGANSLTLSALDLLNLADTSNTLTVDGDADDKVFDLSGGTWATGTNDGTYTTYTQGRAILRVRTGAGVTATLSSDVSAPTLSNSSPADDATGVTLASNIVLTFNETVKAGTGNIVITAGTDTRTIAIGDTGQVSIVGNIVTINPAADLNPLANYNVQMASGVITDIANNPYAGITNATTLDFTTAPRDNINLSTLDGSSGFRLLGSSGERSGFSVSAAGDVNNDGFADLIVGAPVAASSSGRSYVVFGKSSFAGASSSIALSTLDGTTGFRLNGKTASELSGYSVSTAGDVNGDGIGDLFVGAFNADGKGAGYVVFGKSTAFASSLDLSGLDGATGFKLAGVSSADQTGFSASDAGDINGDGIGDLIIGARWADPNSKNYAGSSYVVYGKTSGFASSINLSGLDGGSGFRLNGAATGDRAGHSVSAAGDVNGDGYADFVVGATNAGSGAYGVSYVVFGKPASAAASIELSSLNGINGVALTGGTSIEHSGVSVSSAGDVNGDGYDDLIIGASDSDRNTKNNSGSTYIVFGKSSFAGSSSLGLGGLNGSTGFRIDGAAAEDLLGFSVSSAGDLNGDGFDDLLVGAKGATSSAGASYVIFGQSAAYASTLSPAALNGFNGFRLDGKAANDLSGYSVNAAGDVNGDGFADLVIGAKQAYSSSNNGVSYVLFGGNSTAAVNHLGTSGADNLTASAAGKRFVAGDGDDTMTGLGGADSFHGGKGNDRITIADLAFLRIDGGSGSDTLALSGSGQNLSLATARGRIDGIETIDLTGSGANTLTLNGRNVANLSETTNTLTVDGDGDDVLSSSDWVLGASGGGYTTYTQGLMTLRLNTAISAPGITTDTTAPLLFTTTPVDNATGTAVGGNIVLTFSENITADSGNLIISNGSFDTRTIAVGDASQVTVSGNTVTINPSADLHGNRSYYIQIPATAFKDASNHYFAGIADTTTLNFSTAQASTIDLSLLGNGTTGFRVFSTTTRIANSLNVIGDLNGDGFDDLIIGGRYDEIGCVVFGKASGFSSDLDIANLNSSNGFQLVGGGAAGTEHFGVVGRGGDINGDGYADLIIGAPDGDPNSRTDAGAAYVVFGKPSGYVASLHMSTLNGSNGFRLEGKDLGDHAGMSVGSIGDINGDGFADLAVGANQTNGTGIGRAYVVFGKASGFAASINLSTLDGTNGFVMDSPALDAGDRFVSAAGDVNGDGYGDFLVGAKFGDNAVNANAGATYLVFGRPSGYGSSLDLATLNGSTGVRLVGKDLDDNTAWSVSAAGDVNGDGYADLIIGGKGVNANGTDSGAAYVVFGKSASFASSVDLSGLNGGTTGFRLEGVAGGDYAGWSVSSAGDINGDGYSDLLVGAEWADPNGDKSGSTYVVYGKVSGFGSTVNLSTLDGSTGFRLDGSAANQIAGRWVSAAGDVNGDGFADLMVSAYRDSGSGYVVFGGNSTNSVTWLGGSGNDSFSGNSSAERFVAGTGDDAMSGWGGADVFHGGAGNDSISVNDLNFRLVDGGSGTDTLSILTGSPLSLTLASFRGRLQGIETIAITGNFGVNNTLQLNSADLVNLSDSGNTLTIDGDAGDVVSGGGTWSFVGTAGSYHTYAKGQATLRINTAMTVGDLTGPSLSLTSPLDNATQVAIDSNIVLDFDENVIANSGNVVISDGAGDTRTIAIGDTSQITFSGSTVTINPTANLGVLRNYSVQIAPGAIRDANNNYFAGITDSTTLNFTTPPANLVLSTLNGSNGFRVNGETAFDNSGVSVSSAGDINGDGLDDLIIGAKWATLNGINHDGASYVVFSQSTGMASNLNLSALDGSAIFRLVGVAENDQSGYSVSSAGDVNGDGFADLIVGARPANGSSGASYVVFGKSAAYSSSINLSGLDGTSGFRLNGVALGDYSGNSVGSAGDVNGDGYDDLVVGAWGAPNAGNIGATYVIFGKSSSYGSAMNLSSLDGTTGFRLDGVAAFDYAGISVSTAGDVNGDGFADLIVGAWGSPGGVKTGASYVVFGKASFAGSSTIALAGLDGNTGFKLVGEAANDRSGFSVSDAGDVNGDGYDDIIVGARWNDAGGADAGASYVVFGKSSFATTSSIDLSSLDGNTGFRLVGEAATDWAGFSVSTAGDVNGDGFADILVGAQKANPSNLIDAGAAYLIYGKSGGFGSNLNLSGLDGTNGFRIDSAEAGEYAGSSVSSAGDVNGDGFDDLMVGAIGANAYAGASFVVYGSNSTGAVTYLGNSAANTQTGTGSAERFVGGGGNDTMTGNGGADVFHAGTGDDTISIADLNFSFIDGGSGSDKLTLSGSMSLTLSSFRNRIENIEKIDLVAGSINNTLTLSAIDVVNLSETGNTLTILGDAGDVVHFGSGWTYNGLNGSYDDYTQGQAHLLINPLVAAGV